MVKTQRILLAILWLQVGWTRGKNKAEQSPEYLISQEGEFVTINCSYSTGMTTLQWLQQISGGSIVSLFLLSLEMKKKGRFSATINIEKSRSSLHITAAQPRDSANYICAVSNYGGEKLTFGTGTRVTITPIIHQPDPSVYKLRGPKSSNTSVCLLTDFASQDNVTQEMKHMVFRSGSTALDVKAMDSKSNGALAWSNSINFECNSAFETYAFYPSSEYSCDAKLVEKSFETDMNLNFQNLSVIALRILLLKVAGFNLLMTLRLWSS